MAFTAADEKRLRSIETIVYRLSVLIEGAGSKNQLNRLLVLAQNQVDKLSTRVDALETQMDEILELARRLQ